MGRGLGFMVPFFIAAWFGVTEQTDAFFYAYGWILFLAGIFSRVLENIVVPFIAQALSEKRSVGEFIGSIMGVGGAAMIGLAIIMAFAAKPLLMLITRFDEGTIGLVFKLLLETSPLLLLLVFSSVVIGAANALKKFAFPAFSPGLRAVVTLAVILLLKASLGIHSVAVGYLLGETVRLVALLWVLGRQAGIRIRVTLRLDSRLLEFFKTASYQLLGMLLVGFTPIVDKTMASWLGTGSVSLLHYADRLYIVPVTLLSAGFLTALLSHWSERFYGSGIERLERDVARMMPVAFVVSILVAGALFAGSRFFVHLTYGHGGLGEEALGQVRLLWLILLIGFIPQMVSMVLVHAHLVLKNTVFLLKLAGLSLTLNLVLNLVLMQWLGLTGIVISTSASSFVTLWFTHRAFRKIVHTLGSRLPPEVIGDGSTPTD